MNGSKFDILIVAHEKDFNKLRFLYESIQKNIIGFDKIFVVTNTKVRKPDFPANYLLDKDVINFKFRKFKGNIKARTGWYKQQFVKLFQQVTKNEYLVLDADIYINKPLPIISHDKPCFLFGKDQLHQSYFDFTKEVFGFGKEFKYSFINEIMYFKRDLINNLLSVGGYANPKQFFESAVKALNRINHKTSSFSEYETYGNFVYKYAPTMYKYIFIKTESLGRHRVFSDEEMYFLINKYKNTDVEKLSFHTWI